MLELHGTIHEAECLGCRARVGRADLQATMAAANAPWMEQYGFDAGALRSSPFLTHTPLAPHMHSRAVGCTGAPCSHDHTKQPEGKDGSSVRPHGRGGAAHPLPRVAAVHVHNHHVDRTPAPQLMML